MERYMRSTFSCPNLAFSLGLFLFSIYLLSYRGGFHSVDEVSMFAVTESLVKFGHFDTDQIAWTQWTTAQAEAQGFFGRDGRVYSKKGLALSLAQAPLYGLALLLPGLGMLQTVSLLNAILTAATALLLYHFAHRLGWSTRTGLWLALTFGLATIAFVYAKYLFSEPLAALLLLLTAYALLAYRQSGKLRYTLLAGLAAGLAVLSRANNLFLLPVFSLYLLWVAGQRRSTEPIRTIVLAVFAFALAVLGPGLILLAYNGLRSGNPLQTGYDLTLFSANFGLGLYKLLFSPLRGLFIYSPILMLSLPGWWAFRRRFPAEAWLLAGCSGVTVALFAFWSSGEGLSWGSRFLVPVGPMLTLLLAPLFEGKAPRSQGSKAAEEQKGIWPAILYPLLLLSLIVQLLGITINPWLFLAKLQADFGGEFFLENTAALYDFRTSQIVGQWQNLALENSDLAWLRWGFDGWAFGLSLGLVLISGYCLWFHLPKKSTRPLWPLAPLLPCYLAALLLTYLLLVRYDQTDRQFGPPDDGYSRALNQIAPEAETILTVAQNHYHVPMNRFKARVRLVGFAQQQWPPPATALPLLAQPGPTLWLVTVGFPPAAPDNATERWLALNHFKAGESWLDDSVRLVRFAAGQPTTTRPVGVSLGSEEITLHEVRLKERLAAGQALPVEFVWQPARPPQADYTLFLQLLNQAGALLAQHDSPPNGGYAPTSTWPATRPVTTRQALVIPVDLPAGTYRLIAGLYQPATGQRLLSRDQADFVDLGLVTVIGP
jgi:4-amino-4-deoxy-L-arabinose transferase-like glycosyltransferase